MRSLRRKKQPIAGLRFEYETSLNAYYITANSELDRLLLLNTEEFYDHISQDYGKIFKEYDEKVHSLSLMSIYGSEIYPKIDKFPVRVWKNNPENECNLPLGIYQLQMTDNYGLVFKPYSMLNLDQYIDLGRQIGNLKENFEKFKTLKERIKKSPVKIRHKQGTLLYGPPGTGKTREIIRLFEDLKEPDFYTLIVPKSVRIEQLQGCRDLFAEKGVEIVFIIEEITERTKHGTEDLLTFLDGEFSWEHSYIIATTNYPDQLESNLIDRPGRFEKYIYMGPPTKTQLVKFMQAFEISDESIKKIILRYASKELSLDYYRYIVIQHKLMDRDLNEIFEELETTRSNLGTSLKSKMGIGL